MAVTANIKSVGLKIVSNYGEQNGKIVKKSKTYSDVKSDASNESIYNTYKWIKNMQEPIGESCTKAVIEELMDVA
ncbi:DUF1659 domain-containing protein [Eubacterium maltosivorans]|uniref:DUF1659 domain-containing protein n=1 Tax=Eubacterium maltosivorans TaxID=2041044 RepID=A0A4P9CBY6_EUBML|nr:DUF1659 domain-containing protein [Eubacterium maltosivorans]QCT72355.1 DUF1659 domain-containing protein [Eubacterium maltosivorans]